MPQHTSQASLERLRRGNARYRAGTFEMLDGASEKRPSLSCGQHPHSIVVGCSDSRVPPEIVFDQGLGELFVVRAAGNVLDTFGLGSIEYAVEHLDVPLIVILAHASCGAVSAALAGPAEGPIGALLSEIEPSIHAVRSLPGDLLELATRENAVRTAWRLVERTPSIADRLREGRLQVLAAYNDLAEGSVSFFTAAPSGLDLDSFP